MNDAVLENKNVFDGNFPKYLDLEISNFIFREKIIEVEINKNFDFNFILIQWELLTH